MKRMLALFLALALLPALFSGCRKNEGDAGPSGLGNRYTGVPMPWPDGDDTPQNSVPPLWDEEAGTLSCLRSGMTFSDSPNSAPILTWSIVTTDEAAVLSEEVLPLDEHASIACGWLEKDVFTFLFTVIDYEKPLKQGDEHDYYLGRYDRRTGEVKSSECVNRFFTPGSVSYIFSIAADGDGTVWAGGMGEVVVFSPEFVYLKSVPISGNVSGVGVKDGEVRAVAHDFSGSRTFLTVSAVNTESGRAEERFRLDRDTLSNPRFGSGRDLYFCDDRGVWGVSAREDGTAEAELLMDYSASDISRTESTFSTALDENRFIFMERGQEGERWTYAPFLYTRAEDLDLSDVVTLTAAYWMQDSRLSAGIVAFNKAHPGIRIVPEDYSRFNTGEEPEGGQKKLAMDMVTGVFRPDIVIGSSSAEPMRQITAKKLYLDLSPYLASDDLVNRDNLFGAVLRSFDDGEGGVWGLTTRVDLMTLASTRDALGESLAEKGYWTFGEMVEYIASLPGDTAFCELPCREMLSALLVNYDGCGEFLDLSAGTCSFDGPEFRKFLGLSLALPSLEEVQGRARDPDELMRRYSEGKIALRDVTLDAPEAVIGLPALFRTDDWVLIGLPTGEARDGAGIAALIDNALVVTSSCEAPDAAWAFLRSFFEGSYPILLGGQNHLPALRSQMDEVLDGYVRSGQEFVYFFDGTHRTRFGDRDDPMDPAELEKPGVVSFFTDEHRKILCDILDRAGMPLASSVDEQITAIIGEELSALWGRVSSVDDCASRIQSRVSLWLAEHK